MLQRAGELSLFSTTGIPKQGILFHDMVPVDKWKYLEDGKRVQRSAGKKADPQTSRRSPSPPPVLSKDSDKTDDIHTNGMTRPSFIISVNTNFVNQRS